MFEEQTRTSTTDAEYRKIWTRLEANFFETTCGVFIDDHYVHMAHWFNDLKPNYAKATQRKYRSALVQFFGQMEMMAPALKIVKEQTTVDPIVSELRTSQKKAKKVSENDLKLIIDHLDRSNAYWAERTKYFLLAGLLTGLRPDEWRQAVLEIKTIEEEPPYYGYPYDLISVDIYEMEVVNGKATNNRSHGEMRHLDLSGFADHEIAIIKKHMEFLSYGNRKSPKGNSITFKQYYASCRNFLYKTYKKLFPRRKKTISLYSARHQNIANLKHMGLKREEIAALVGHGSDRTATIHYAKGRSGRGQSMAKPRESEVNRVRISNKSEFTPKIDPIVLASEKPPQSKGLGLS